MANNPAQFDNLNTAPPVVPPPPVVVVHPAGFDNLNIPVGLPPAVSGVAVSPAATTVVVAWDSSTAPSVLYYTVSLTDTSTATTTTLPTQSGTSASFAGLTPNHGYFVSVVVTNPAGDSAPSTVSFLTTSGAADPGGGGVTGGSGGSLPPVAPPVATLSTLLNGQAFPAGKAFRPQNFGLTSDQATV